MCRSLEVFRQDVKRNTSWRLVVEDFRVEMLTVEGFVKIRGLRGVAVSWKDFDGC